MYISREQQHRTAELPVDVSDETLDAVRHRFGAAARDSIRRRMAVAETPGNDLVQESAGIPVFTDPSCPDVHGSIARYAAAASELTGSLPCGSRPAFIEGGIRSFERRPDPPRGRRNPRGEGHRS